MNADDPFFALGGERTIIKPRLGKPASSAIQSLDNILGPSESIGRAGEAEHTQAQARFDHMLNQLQQCPAASQNALLAKASPLLRMICLVGNMAEVPSPKAVSNTLAKGLRELDQTLEEMQRPQAERLSVRYVLCTFIDERAANTPGVARANGPITVCCCCFLAKHGAVKRCLP